jgi:hypothetical protein
MSWLVDLADDAVVWYSHLPRKTTSILEVTMAKRVERTVNLVRSADSDTYEVVSNADMMSLYSRYNIVHEKVREDSKNHLTGYFYVKVPK